MEWLGDTISMALDNALWSFLGGVFHVVPIEVWVVAGGVVALVILKFTGWPGVAGAVGIAAYVLGVMRGREMAKPPKAAPKPAAPAPKKRRTLADAFREGIGR